MEIAPPKLAAKSVSKAAAGYGRWLNFLAGQGWLDNEWTAKPSDRLTAERVGQYVDDLHSLENRDFTVLSRVQELQIALRILEPGIDVRWLTRPAGVPLRQQLNLQKRPLAIHHSGALFDWGLELLEGSGGLAPRRRAVQLRDGLLIALLAARGLRLRSIHALQLGSSIHHDGQEWRIALDGCDTKNGRPLDYPVPRQLDDWVHRYISVERRELLGGAVSDALWINWGGQDLGLRGLEKRVRWWSGKRFGGDGVFGPHRFRHCIATTGPIADPANAGVTAALLGITRAMHDSHYDRGKRAAAATSFLAGLDESRQEARQEAMSATRRSRCNRAEAFLDQNEDAST